MTAIPVSTVPAVKAALKTALEARSELTGVLVEYEPVTTWLADDMVVIGRTEGRRQVARMVGGGGAGWQDEEYTLTVSCLTYRGDGEDGSAQANLERAFTLAAVVADVVRLDPSIGGLVTQADPSGFVDEARWDDEGLGLHFAVDVLIHVEATL